MNNEEKFNLITRNLQEIINEQELKELLKKNKEPSVYWGAMPTGSPHVSYYLPLLKVGDFLKAGLKVKILIADLHAALDGVPWEILEKRQEYYEELIPAMLESISVNIKKLEFTKGSKIQLNPKYFEDLLKLSTFTSIRDATKAASEVVKLGDNPKLGGIVYPLMQALDEEYLKVDMQFGGQDQRKIFVFAREFLPKIGYKPRIELMNPMISGLIGEKMSSSVEGSKIDMLDNEETVIKKINSAMCEEGNPNNGLLAFMKYVIMTIKEDKKEKFIVKRPEKFGGNKSYKHYDEIEQDFIKKKLHPLDLKNAMAEEINKLLTPIRKNIKLKTLYEKAYSK